MLLVQYGIFRILTLWHIQLVLQCSHQNKTRGGGETTFRETRRDEILAQKNETRRDVSRDTLTQNL